MEVFNASKTGPLMAASVGRWFIILSVGCKMSQACCSLASMIAYATNCAWVAVTGGTVRCGLIGTGCMMGLLDVSRTGVLVKTSTRESSAAR
jgi:hypothetical protein